ncbi:MAG: ABC transporter permease [Thermogemmatispora sp.]|jgi:oligopeptide transport system permease protein|uniref:Glutathione ABC transporter permease GsiD n=1 Tax=Thermogemmatispora aurantia TaxID=2045279 RepID=A0A5J4K8F0_9CHLR|nr:MULTISPECIES: ABC transporter permease [Thermogemmatispora]MBE3567166.1 ABC transporter permease [Thermogemmatispora sp.]GER83362.1 glutathione ABC transporter permease GsiD [Thermogemmatispora aurantia]
MSMDAHQRPSEAAGESFVKPDAVLQPPPAELLELAAGVSETPPGAVPLGEEEVLQERRAPSPLRESLRRLRRDKRAMVSLGLIIFFVLVAFFGPPIYQHIGGIYQSPQNGPVPASVYHSYYHEELIRQDEGPSAQYWLGTDDLGRDILARLMQGMLVSIIVATLVEVVDIVLGLIVGVLAGYFGGWIDQLLARFTDLMFAFPGLLFAIMLTGIIGPGASDALAKLPIIGPNGNGRLLLVSLALAITVWPLMARYVRGQTLQLKEQQFIEAARTSGSSDLRIIFRHVIPNLMSIVVVASTLNISNTIIGEAGISLLGLGVQAPGSSLGLMISDATPYINTHPWEILVPTTVLALIVLAFSFLGDGLRDAFDPRSKD